MTPLSSSRVERRILAVVLPELLHELALQRSIRAPGPRQAGHSAKTPVELSASRKNARSENALPRVDRVDALTVPRGIVLSDAPRSMLEPTTRLDAVNIAARRRGVSTRHTIAQASAIIANLQICALPPACVSQTLQHIAEAALAFGSPVSFRAPDTVWVDVSGTIQLFGGERELALALCAHVRALGHIARVAVAPGPWLARAFARHADFDETGTLCVAASEAEARSGLLPIGALPLADDVVAWFARLGLLTIDDLRKLPTASLAARIETPGFERTLDLIRGRDDGVLDAHQPEDLPLEEQSWDYPLENVEPLLFVLKGLAARLGARLEGRGQAAQELLLSVQYDKGIMALRAREGARQREGAPGLPSERLPAERTLLANRGEARDASFDSRSDALEISFRLASPLSHAEDLERIVRSRLQREILLAPARGLRLQATAITEAAQWQQSLNVDGGLRAAISGDPRTLAVLVAELSADIGSNAVGRLATHSSHLLEKSSEFVPIHRLTSARSQMSSGKAATSHRTGRHRGSLARCAALSFEAGPFEAGASQGDAVVRLPTRLLSPIEFSAPLKARELVVLERRAFVIESVRFEERLEAVEWWASSPVSRDYFRLWLCVVQGGVAQGGVAQGGVAQGGVAQGGASQVDVAKTSVSECGVSNGNASGKAPKGGVFSGRSISSNRRGDGMEVLVYLNRDDGKKYVQGVYD